MTTVRRFEHQFSYCLCTKLTFLTPERLKSVNLISLNLRGKYGINVVSINKGAGYTNMIDPNEPLTKDMDLLCVLSKKDASKLK